MALSVIYIPETGESWDNAWEASEYGRKGKMALSLTGYDTASAPLIASGSWCEIVGSIFTTSGQQSISGTPATGLAYIKMVTSGATSALVATPTWTATAPTWSDTYQGWYIDTYRVVAGCYYGSGGTDYLAKVILENRHCNIENSYVQVPPIGEAEDVSDTKLFFADYLQLNAAGIIRAAIPVSGLLENGDVITEFSVYISSYTSGEIDVDLRRSEFTSTSSDVIANLPNLASANTHTQSTISNAEVDKETYAYTIYLGAAVGTNTLAVPGIRIKRIRAYKR